MRRDLTGPVAAAQWPRDIQHSPLGIDQTEAAYRLLTLGYQQGEGRLPAYATWLAAFERDPEFDRSLCFLAFAGDEVVGVVICWTSTFIKDLAVHPDHRKRGVGAALLNHSFAHLRGRGEGHVDLHVMENNVDARRLYENQACPTSDAQPPYSNDLP